MEHDENQLKELIKLSKLELPFEGFEERMIAKIHQVEQQKAKINNSQKYALIFFALGTFFGLILNYLFTEFIQSLQMDSFFKNNLILFAQLIYVLLIVIFSDKIWQLIKAIRVSKIYERMKDYNIK